MMVTMVTMVTMESDGGVKGDGAREASSLPQKIENREGIAYSEAVFAKGPQENFAK